MKKVLIVEDESVFLNILRAKMKELGFEVHYATDGLEALDKFERDNPDIVLLDMLLPEKSGYDVLKEIRGTHKTPVIILTNVSTKKERDEVEALNIQDYIVKSEVSLEEVLQRIAKIVK